MNKMIKNIAIINISIVMVLYSTMPMFAKKINGPSEDPSIQPWVYWYIDGTEIHYSSTLPSNSKYRAGQCEKDRGDGYCVSAEIAPMITRAIFDNEVKARETRNWFNGFCNMVEIVNLEYLDTSFVYGSMDNMFKDCRSLKSLNLSNFQTLNIYNMNWMFTNCSSLTMLDISSFETPLKPEVIDIFCGCTSLKEIYATDAFKITTKEYKKYEYKMFENCVSLVGENGTVYDADNICREYARIDTINSPGYFRKGKLHSHIEYELNYTWIENCPIDKSSITKVSFKKGGLISGTFFDIIDASGGDIMQGYLNGNEVTIYTPYENDKIIIEFGHRFFYGFENLVSIENFGIVDTSKNEDTSYMFCDCKKISQIDLFNFCTKNVKEMERMFGHCESLVALDLSNFNTSKVENMNRMFEDCISLQALNLSSFDTSNVTGMEEMFRDCKSLVSLDLSNFDIINVRHMNRMFYFCTLLTNLNIPNFNITTAQEKDDMFRGCDQLVLPNV